MPQRSTTRLLKQVCNSHQMYSWLNWGPAEGSPCYNKMFKCFPNALPSPVVVQRTAAVLEKLGFDDENTIYGQSICPDEINNEEDSLAVRMAKYWGEVFPMGGIGGAPFVGKTGFKAFSSHVPDDGNVLILYGPHIGITKDGEIGSYHRLGQSKPTAACGALLAAYASCLDGDIDFDPEDMQQSWLKDRLMSRVGEIKSAEEPIAALAHQSFELISGKLDLITDTSFGEGHLALLGGIQINLPEPYCDHFYPLKFEVMSKQMDRPIDLLAEAFAFQLHFPGQENTAA